MAKDFLKWRRKGKLLMSVDRRIMLFNRLQAAIDPWLAVDAWDKVDRITQAWHRWAQRNHGI